MAADTPRLHRNVQASLDSGAGDADETSPSSPSGKCPICVRPMSCSERLFAASCGYLCHLACMQRFSQQESQSGTASRICPVCFSPHPRASYSSVDGHGLRSVNLVVSTGEASREFPGRERRLSRSHPVSPVVQDVRPFDNRTSDGGRQQIGASLSATRTLETSPGASPDLMALLAARDVINKALETHYPGLAQPRAAQPCRDLPPRRTLQKAASAPAQSFHDALRELGLKRPGSYEENVFPGGAKFESQGAAASPRAGKSCSSLFSPPPTRGLPPAATIVPGQRLQRAASLPLPPQTRPLGSAPKELSRVPGGKSESTPRKQRHLRKYDSDSGGLPPVKETESGSGEAFAGLRFHDSGLQEPQSVHSVTERLADFYRMTAQHGGRSNRKCSGATDNSGLTPLRLQRTKSM